MMPTISQEEVALITDEWNVYMAGAVDTDDRLCRRESRSLLGKCLSREISPEQVQVFYSSEACQVFFPSFKGNADVEQSLSADKKTVTSDRAALSDVTINGLRTVKDHVKLCGATHCSHWKRTSSSNKKGTQRIWKRLSKEKEELLTL